MLLKKCNGKIQLSGALGVLTLCLLPVACTSSPENELYPPTFHNPINSTADPFVMRHNNQSYLTGTSTGSSLELWHSPNLGTIGHTPVTTIWTPKVDEPYYQVWSPSMFFLSYQGTYYWFVYFTASLEDANENHRIYVLQSKGADPLGPYTFKGQLGKTSATPAIDPSILRIKGQMYIMYVLLEHGKNAVFIAPLSDPLTQGGLPHLLISPDQSWERGTGSGQSTYPVVEGPTALYHNGKTFIVYSGSDTGNYNYCLGLLTYNGKSDPLQKSSWAKTGPVFLYSEANGVYGPGRATFTISPDGKQNWMVYHAKSTSNYTYEGRVTRAQQFTWNADGSPNFGIPVSLKSPLTLPTGETIHDQLL